MRLAVQPAAGPLGGRLRPPGDKSISHRAVILAGLADGRSVVAGWLASADVRATVSALRQLGARIEESPGQLVITGVGRDGLAPSAEALDMGNSGTAMRLLAGVLAAQPFDSRLTGDASLSRRPMRRIIEPLAAMGARIEASPQGTPPLAIHGNPGLQGIDYRSPVASAQVKSCLLLAGLFAQGRTSVREPAPSRDHTERMLPQFGVELAGPCAVEGGARLSAARIQVPADPSSAAFLAAAACLVPASEVLLEGVGLNPTRAAFFEVLRDMGGQVDVVAEYSLGGEPAGDLRVRHSGDLGGVELAGERIPALIDEVPVLLALAAVARGRTRVRGAAELRVKESDRLAVMGAALRALGISATEVEDGIDIEGGQPRGASVEAGDDHRCAMSLAVLGQRVPGGLDIGGAGYIDTSYPGFSADLQRLGAGRMAFRA